MSGSKQDIQRKAWNKATFGTELENAFHEEIPMEKVIQTLKGMLDAEIESKSGFVRPDFRTRERAVTLYLAYTIGTPVQRHEQVNYNMDMSELDNKQLMQKLAENPAMLDKVQAMLDEARGMRKVEGGEVQIINE